MSVLTIGDPHFQMSNMDEVKQFVKACLAHARETSPFRIVVLGDVLHDHERVRLETHWLILPTQPQSYRCPIRTVISGSAQ